ncbi:MULTISPECIES: hypothetical protein [Bacillus cereus group]|nr:MULTISPECIES: hypothetical protein [Bacillus cereus group]MEB9629832.1 hypothetical protein [Bacillus anthracis]
MLASENKTIVREYRESKGLSIKEVSKGAKIPIEKLFIPTYYRAIPITE